MAGVQDSLGMLAMYVRMVWRFRWVALVTAVMVSSALWLIVMLLPNTYEVSTKVYLDTKSILRPLLKGIAVDASQTQETVKLISRTLLVRPNLEAVARKTDMDLSAKTPKAFDDLVTDLGQRIKVRSTRRNNIFIIRFIDSEPKRAYRVVEALLNILVERSLGETRKDTSSTRQFIDEQIKEYETRLLAAEARLKEFKRQNVGLLPGESGGYYDKLENLGLQVSEAKLALNESERRVAAITAQLKGVPAYFKPTGGANGEAASNDPLYQRIQKTQEALDEMLRRYTERHPDVRALKDSLGALQSEYDAARKARKAASGGSPDTVDAIPNPLYQELMVSKGEAEAEVAALKARVQEYERRQEKLRQLVDTVPKVEAELARLNRDYNVDQNNYSELVQRREALKISNDASRTTDDVRFNVIEPPREPLSPKGPNRVLFSAGALIVGLGAGLGFAFLLGLLKPAFYSRVDFESVTRAPVLGVISRVWTPQEQLRRRVEVFTFATGCVCLVLVFGAVMTLHTVYSDEFHRFDVQSKVQRLKDRLT